MNYSDEVKTYPADEEVPETTEVICTAVFSTHDAIELCKILQKHPNNAWAVGMLQTLKSSLDKIGYYPAQ